MQIRLSYKLFSAFFLILAIVAGAMMLSRHIFSITFKNYLHQVEMEKLESLVPALQEMYRARNSWEGITTDPHYWRHQMKIAPNRSGWLPPPPPAKKPALDTMLPAGDRHSAAPSGILLMDERQRPIIGIPGPNDQPQLIAVEVGGRVVGWLGLQSREHFRSGPPAELLESQTRLFYLLGGAVIGLTALIAFLFSRHLLKPIQRLARGTHELAQRNFTVRIEPTTRDELGELAENFNAMARTLEEYEKMRQQWLTDISHELRTPLAVLRGEIEAIQDGVREPSPRNLASLHAEILRIGKLVEDLHLLSTADSDSLYLKKAWIFPRTVLEDIAGGFRSRFELRRIRIDLMLDDIEAVRIQGDADRLGQVFANILENACKYAQSPGSLEISGRADDQGLFLCFQDSGPGVPEDALPRLFDRLYRVEASRSRDSGGSGLGLSICRHIVEHHGGRIWAENSSTGGLSIRIRLPFTQKESG